VIIKSKPGKYDESNRDGKITYAFQARNNIVDKSKKANQALIKSKGNKYPLLTLLIKAQIGSF
jgi:hypothetical protein